MTRPTKPASVKNMTPEANTLLANKARLDRHGEAERLPDVDGIMATVTPPGQLTWSGCLAWALGAPDDHGLPTLTTRTTYEGIREFYEWRVSDDVPGRELVSQIDYAGSWYVFHEEQPQAMFDVTTGSTSRTIDPITFFSMDGDRGISSEIAWLRTADPRLDVATRANRWTAYLDALRAHDADRLADLMAPNVQSAVRDYTGTDPDFVAIHGREEMRAYYQRMFATFDVLAVEDLIHFLRDWFVFGELLITVRARDGADSGREFALRIAESLVFDVDGSFQGRVGYGTALESV